MTESRFRRPTFWLLAALVVLAAGVRFKSLNFGLPHTQARPDETAIIEPVRALLAGRLPNFFDYPWLFLFVVMLAYLGYFVWGAATGAFHSVGEMLASWPVHWEPFFLIPRAISATLGTLSVLLISRLGRQLRDETTGLLAALFLAFAFIHARDSHFGTTDIAMTFLVLGAVTLLLDAHRTRSRRDFAVAGLVAGLAAATKYNAVILVVPMLVSQVLTAMDSPGRRLEALLDVRIAVFGGAFAAAFAIGLPFVVLDWSRFVVAMSELSHSMAVGDPRLDLGNGWWHHLEFSLRYGVGLPLLVAGLAGAGLLLVREPRKGALVLSFPIVYYAVAGSINLLFFRYTMPTVPFLCLTAAYLVTTVVEETARQWTRRPAVARVAIAAIGLALVWPSAVNIWAFDRVIGETDNRVVVAHWFAANVPPGSSVLQSGSPYGLAQFEQRLGYHQWLWDRARRTFLVDGHRTKPADRPDWIVVQDSPLPSSTQDVVTQFLAEPYTLVTTFPALNISDDLVYDRLDMFFVPFNGFDRIVRPGPNFSVYKRDETAPPRDAQALAQ